MEKPMLKIIFFARLREIISIEQLSLELDPDNVSTVKDIIAKLREQYSTFNDYLDQGNRLMVAVNQDITDVDKELLPGDELALFPPVTGG